jgi:replication factor C subunit 2/4
MDLWTDKYNPKTFDDLVLNDMIKKKLNFMVGNLQNAIFVGGNGVGKTSSVNCLMNKIYENEVYRYVYELKIQEDNGISALFKSLQSFCKKKVLDNNLFKVVIINDADDLNTKIQQMINSIMEQFAEKCKFIITCIDSTNIIEGIQNKCVLIKFPKLMDEYILSKLKYICLCEKLNYTDIDLLMLVNGDLRNAILNLQVVGLLYDTINKENICYVLGIPNVDIIRQIIDYCIDKKINEASQEILKTKNMGYLHSDILFGLLNFSKSYEKIDEMKRIKYFKIISSIILCVNSGIITDLQLLRCVAELCDVF